MRLRGAGALVTGGSSGIGAATARALAAAGATPLIAGRDRGRLEAVARQTGGLALEADLGSADGPAALAQAALRAAGSLCSGPAAGPERTGGIDILINNAGVGWSGPLSEMTAEKVTELVAVNLTAPIQLTRLLVPGMAARGRGRGGCGSAIPGATGVRGEAVYAAAKAGLGYFAESLADELSARGVGVPLILPGRIGPPFCQLPGPPYRRA